MIIVFTLHSHKNLENKIQEKKVQLNKHIIQLPSSTQEDYVSLSLTATGMFSIQSTWQALRHCWSTVPWRKIIWFKHHIPKWGIIQWMAAWGRRFTMDRIQNWGLIGTNRCVQCRNVPESHEHLFLPILTLLDCGGRWWLRTMFEELLVFWLRNWIR